MSIKDVDPGTLVAWLSEGKAVLVDVRESGERARERIAIAHHVPLSTFHEDHLPEHDDKIVVYHCASGMRTARFGAHLSQAVPAANDVYHLAGGIMAWVNAGHQTEVA